MNKMNVRLFMNTVKLFAILILSLSDTFAEVNVSKIFSDNMVLQRDINAPVWGTAKPGEKIIVEINGLVCSTVTADNGEWSVYLPVFEAGGPYEMMIKGDNEIKFIDVMFGDVWVASGQSNMAWQLQNSNNGDEEVQDAN